MISYLTKRVFDAHLVHYLSIEDVKHWLDFSVHFVTEVLFADTASVIFLLKQTHFFFYAVYLLDYFLYIYCLDFLLHLLLTLHWQGEILEILSAHIFFNSCFPTLVFSHVVLLHLFQQLQVLRLCNLFISHTHMSIHRSNSAHREVSHI